MCSGDQRIEIFTYEDNQPGSTVSELMQMLGLREYSPSTSTQLFSGHCPSEEITSMCAVHSMVWMGTLAGTLKVFHAPTLKIRFKHTLQSEAGSRGQTISDIVHVEEMQTVLVSTSAGEVWSFLNTSDKLRLQCKIKLTDGLPCHHLVKVSCRIEAMRFMSPQLCT